MKVLMLNTFNEIGGAARAATRLLHGVRDLGLDARLLVHYATGKAPATLCPAGRLRSLARRLKMTLGTLPVRRYPKAPINNFSPAVLPDHLETEIAAINPDIIHLHWLGAGFLRLETLGSLNRPLLWTLHDSWPFTGGCHVPFDCTKYRQTCGACPVLGSTREEDLSRRVWQRKQRAWQDLDLTLVAPSRWLAEAARSSSLFHETRIDVIPNGLDAESFPARDKALSRNRLHWPQDKKIILFGGIRALSDPNKGFHLLRPALQSLGIRRRDLMAVAFSAFDQAEISDLGLPTVSLGQIDDDESLSRVYSAADVFVVPSLQETFCQTATEAMSCGTPVVAFAATGLLDIVDHQKTGYLVKPYDISDLAQGIAWVLEDQERHAELCRRARRKVASNFLLTQMAQRYVNLYEKVLNRQKT
jgi:glycosyltransferase involved in cell wall biosynthesis